MRLHALQPAVSARASHIRLLTGSPAMAGAAHPFAACGRVRSEEGSMVSLQTKIALSAAFRFRSTQGGDQ